jgi:hypothetical protein
MFRSRLQAEGIPAFVVHEYHIGNAWHYSTALCGVKVQVSEEKREEACAIEKRCRSGEFRKLLEDEFGPMGDVHCPNCGSNEYWKRRPLFRAISAIALLALTGVIVPPIGWIYFCDECGTRYRQPTVSNTLEEWSLILAAVACDLAVLVMVVLCIWSLETRYWFVVVLVLIIVATRLTTGRFSILINDQD